MPVCGSDPSHQVNEWWRRNELGRWYECDDCGSTVLSPSGRYRLLLLTLRSRRKLRKGARVLSRALAPARSMGSGLRL